MFTNPDFLSALAVGVGVGLFVLFWIGRRFRAALKEASQPESAVNFWTAVVQISSLLVPVITTLMAQENLAHASRDLAASAIVVAACAGALVVVLAAAIIVGWASPQAGAAVVLTANDTNELRQLLLRMREFRAHEIVRASEAAPKAGQA